MAKPYTRAAMPASVQAALTAQCRARLPYETCGVLYGRIEDGVATAASFALMRNIAARPEASFRFAPDEWVRVSCDALRSGRTIVGVFHSHPSGRALPSAADIAGWDGSGTCWIVALGEGTDNNTRLAVYGHTNGEWYAIPSGTF